MLQVFHCVHFECPSQSDDSSVVLSSTSQDGTDDQCNSKAVLSPNKPGPSQDIEQTEDDTAAGGEAAAAASTSELQYKLPLQKQDISQP